jgi:hypothetical protein
MNKFLFHISKVKQNFEAFFWFFFQRENLVITRQLLRCIRSTFIHKATKF